MRSHAEHGNEKERLRWVVRGRLCPLLVFPPRDRNNTAIAASVYTLCLEVALFVVPVYAGFSNNAA